MLCRSTVYSSTRVTAPGTNSRVVVRSCTSLLSTRYRRKPIDSGTSSSCLVASRHPWNSVVFLSVVLTFRVFNRTGNGLRIRARLTMNCWHNCVDIPWPLAHHTSHIAHRTSHIAHHTSHITHHPTANRCRPLTSKFVIHMYYSKWYIFQTTFWCTISH